MRAELERILAVAWKDLTAERRSKVNFNAVVFLAGMILLLFGFALGPEQTAARSVGGGLIWLTVLFSGVQAFHRSYQLELDAGALDTLLLYPGDRRSIFLGKLLANLVFLLFVLAVLLPTASFLYDLPLLASPLRLAAVLGLGVFGFATLGTFYAAMASRLQAREVLLPLLLFPMLIPLLVGAVIATGALLEGDPMGQSGAWIRLLVVFDVIFFVAAYFAFDHVIEG